MQAVTFNIILILVYFYYIYNIGEIHKGTVKSAVALVLCIFAILIFCLLRYEFAAWILISLIMLLFDLFYDEEPFVIQWKKAVSYGIAVASMLVVNKFFSTLSYMMIYEIIILFCFIVLSRQRKCLSPINGILVGLTYLIIITATYIYESNIINLIMFLLSSLIFLILEVIFKNYQTSFENNTRYFQQNVLHNQYEEIKNIYLNMRGWRHDYHSHLQTIKAHLALNQLDEVQKYLLELEKDLSRVDSYVKSGNLMSDAILNSKISIAENKNINVICKAELPENVIITDIDMCVILGNLLDNAIESCVKIEENKRFIRIYIAVMRKQLYMSIQNSAKEELDFNERNYISTKRGEHGLGMKRVKILVDKYNGYLNLQNEPGIFASELTIPIE